MTMSRALPPVLLIALTLAGCRAPVGSSGAGLDPAAREQARAYVDEINALEKAGKLTKVESRGDDGAGLVLWCRDGRLVKSEHTEVVRAELSLPPLEKVDRLEFKDPEIFPDDHPHFVVKDRGRIALFYQCLRLGSTRRKGTRISYYDADGAIVPYYTTRFHGSVSHECGLGLFFVSGGKNIYGVSGHPGQSEFGSIVNKPLGILLKQYVEAARAEGKGEGKTHLAEVVDQLKQRSGQGGVTVAIMSVDELKTLRDAFGEYFAKVRSTGPDPTPPSELRDDISAAFKSVIKIFENERVETILDVFGKPGTIMAENNSYVILYALSHKERAVLSFEKNRLKTIGYSSNYEPPRPEDEKKPAKNKDEATKGPNTPVPSR